MSAHLDQIACSVRDAAADKHSVYVEWQGIYGQKGRFENNDGSGPDNAKVFIKDDLWRGVDSTVLQWRVCVDVQLRGDKCSDWEHLAVGPNGAEVELYCQAPTSSASHAATCELLRNPDEWVLSNQCMPKLAQSVGEELLLRKLKGIKVVAQVLTKPSVEVALKMKDLVDYREVLMECT